MRGSSATLSTTHSSAMNGAYIFRFSEEEMVRAECRQDTIKISIVETTWEPAGQQAGDRVEQAQTVQN